jgi:hypothetical protein
MYQQSRGKKEVEVLLKRSLHRPNDPTRGAGKDANMRTGDGAACNKYLRDADSTFNATVLIRIRSGTREWES